MKKGKDSEKGTVQCCIVRQYWVVIFFMPCMYSTVQILCRIINFSFSYRGRDRDRDRDRYNPNAFKEKSGYKPDVKLEYVDEHGRQMNPKEVYYIIILSFIITFNETASNAFLCYLNSQAY